MIGEYTKLGEMHEDKAVVVSAVWKVSVFGLLVFAFHIVGEVIKRLIHGSDLARARELRLDQLASRTMDHRGVLHLYPALCLPRIPTNDG